MKCFKTYELKVLENWSLLFHEGMKRGAATMIKVHNASFYSSGRGNLPVSTFSEEDKPSGYIME